jgi:thioredoxin 1
MAFKDMTKITEKLNSEEHWKRILESSSERLIGWFGDFISQNVFHLPLVVDIHQEWCGPCEVIQPTLLKVYTEVNNAEERLGTVTANMNKFGQLLQGTLPEESQVFLEKNGCRPIFAFYRNKACVSVVVGVDAPQILQVISSQLPPPKPTQ